MTGALTPRQQEVLDAIERLTAERGFAPSFKDLMRALGIGSTNGISDHLWALKRKGAIAYEPSVARSIRVLRPSVLAEEQETIGDLESIARRFGYEPEVEYLGEWIEDTARQAGLQEVGG